MMPNLNAIGYKIKHFHLGELLGEGGFAKVYKAQCLRPGFQGEIVAIKKILKVQKQNITDRIQQELAIHSQLQHPSIVKLHTTFEDDENYYLVLEYCERGTLSEYLKLNSKLQEEVAHEIFKQVLEGLLYLHEKNVIHRDLSWKNILLTEDMKVKIADFGLSTTVSSPDETKYTILGTAHFMPPNQHNGSGYGMEVDIWALGCVLYALLVGNPPFNGRTVGEIFKKSSMSKLKIPDYVSKEAKDLIKALIVKDPKRRISLNGVLCSSFFRKYETKPSSRQKLDSGVGLMSSSSTQSNRSGYRSTGSSDSGMGISGNRDYRSPRTSKDIVPMATIHSVSHSYHSYDQRHIDSNCNNSRKQVQSRSKSPPSKLKNSQHQMESTKQVKNKFCMLPSRHEFHNPPTLEVSSRGSGRERSASEERHKQGPQKILNDNAEYFHTHSKEQIDKNAPSYYRHQDNQMRSRPQSPMPYPANRLENIIDENLQKSYSSCESRNPCKSNVSRENVDACRKTQHLVQEQDNRSHYSWEHQSATHSKSNKKKGLIHEKPPPFNTIRLPPYRKVFKNMVVISILSDGVVCIEKLKNKYVSSVYFISPDGMQIIVYTTNIKIESSDKPPDLGSLTYHDSFSYEWMPKDHWHEYLLASCVIKRFKAITVKVSLCSEQGKFMMMENVPPDFTMNFFNGGKITEVSGKIKIINKDGKRIGSLDEDYHTMKEDYNTLKSACEALEKALELLQEKYPECSFFPSFNGKRPSPLNQVTGKENISPSIMSPPGLSKAFANVRSYPLSSYSPLANSRNTTSSPSDNSTKYIENQCDKGKDSKGQFIFKNRSIDDIRINLKCLPRVMKLK